MDRRILRKTQCHVCILNVDVVGSIHHMSQLKIMELIGRSCHFGVRIELHIGTALKT